VTILRQREAGVCLHLTSLPGPYGIGTLGGPASDFIDFIAAAGLGVWQFLPAGPTGFGDSPYQTTSVFAGNPLLIDVGPMLEQGLVALDELAVFEDLPADTVEFDRLIALKSQLLARAAERFQSRASATRRAARDAFVAEHDASWLHDFALFDVLKTIHQHRTWLEWEPAYAQRDPEAMRVLEDATRVQIETAKTIQYFFFEQWAALRAHAASKHVRLMGDVPIYVALDSADAWASPDLFCLDESGRPTMVAGVPPDYFSADGQFWGNPLYRWGRHVEDGFRWWIARLGHATAMADLVRLDHFRGFEAYWAIPASADTARGGQWCEGPGAELFTALQSALPELPIIAEDLGMITPEVEALRERFDLPGMKVLQFIVGEAQFEPELIPENCVCYTGTHDNDTVVGWFHGAAGDTRTPEEIADIQANVLRHTGGRAETVHLDLIKLAFAMPARLAMIPMQDFLGLDSTARLNTPGTTSGNWRWRLTGDQLTPQVGASIRGMLTNSGRWSSRS
jgi:4-alpha-glucanotransferase